MNLQYFIVVSLLTFIVPLIGAIIQKNKSTGSFFDLLSKWFIFSAVGLRLFMAGCRQIFTPSFTAVEIFHMHCEEAFPVVRELGYANFCFGLIGIVSIIQPRWRIVSAFGSGLYYGLAAVQHVIRKPEGANEQFALVTDVLIFIFLLIYIIKNLKKNSVVKS